ncbi:MAG TPA: Fe-S-binding domain-containing protein, partial [Acidimicrobiales bacterium]
MAVPFLAATAPSATSAAFPLLTTLVLLPAVAALIVTLLPRTRPELVKLVGFLAALAEAALCVVLLWQFRAGEGGFQLVTQHSWISDFGISWKL